MMGALDVCCERHQAKNSPPWKRVAKLGNELQASEEIPLLASRQGGLAARVRKYRAASTDRLRLLRWLREIFLMTQPPLLAVMQGGEFARLQLSSEFCNTLWKRRARRDIKKDVAKPPLMERPGWFVQLPIIGGFNEPPRLRPLRKLRVIFLVGASTPPLPRRGHTDAPFSTLKKKSNDQSNH